MANEAKNDTKKAVEESPAAPALALDPVAAFAQSANASTGEVVEIPKTPKEIAKEGTALGIAGDFSTGGLPADGAANAAPVSSGDHPVFQRVWGMDTDHTTNNRHLPDALKPDCSVRVS